MYSKRTRSLDSLTHLILTSWVIWRSSLLRLWLYVVGYISTSKTYKTEPDHILTIFGTWTQYIFDQAWCNPSREGHHNIIGSLVYILIWFTTKRIGRNQRNKTLRTTNIQIDGVSAQVDRSWVSLNQSKSFQKLIVFGFNSQNIFQFETGVSYDWSSRASFLR